MINLDWFMTIPGILIICGVILLIIALVLFVVGAKKSKKTSNNVNAGAQFNNDNVTNINNDGNDQVLVSQEIPVSEVYTATPTIDSTNNTNINEGSDLIGSTNDSFGLPSETQVESSIDFNVSMPEFTLPAQGDNTTNETVSFIDNQVGIKSNVDDNNINTPVTIYGGNDPLEATQALPKIEIHNEPYGGALGDNRIISPITEQPQAEVNMGTEPVIEPIMPVFDIPVAPIEEPIVPNFGIPTATVQEQPETEMDLSFSSVEEQQPIVNFDIPVAPIAPVEESVIVQPETILTPIEINEKIDSVQEPVVINDFSFENVKTESINSDTNEVLDQPVPVNIVEPVVEQL